MKRLLLFAFLIISSPSIAQVLLPDPHPTFDQQLKMLLGVHQHIPWIFEEGAEYDVDFFQLLENNNNIVEMLRTNVEFALLSKMKPPLKEILIEQMRTQVKKKSLISQEAKSKWDRVLTSPELREMRDVATAAAYTNQLEQQILAERQTSAARFIEGLSVMLNSKERQRILSMPTMEEKIAALQKFDFSQQDLLKKFDPTRHGLQAYSYMWAQYIDILQSKIQTEQLILKYWYNQASLVAGQDSSQIVTWLESKKAQFASSKYARLSDLIRGLIKELKTSEISEEFSVHDSFRLVEVPPALGIWRGLVGGDCATSYASAYAYMPTEYTYFIYDKADNLKGYVSLSSVLSAEDGFSRLWYLHDITGSRLSPESMLSIIYGLKKVSKEIGFDQLVMPTPERIKLNNNHMGLILAQQKLIANSPKVALKYIDDNLRLSLANFGIAHNYDSAESNQVAHLLELSKDELDSVKVSVRPTDPPNLLSRQRMGALEGTLLILDLLTSARVEASQQALQAAVNDVQMGGLETNGISYKQRMIAAQTVANNFGLNWQQIQVLNQQLSNFEKKDVESYYSDIEKLFKALGLEFDKDWIKSRAYLFYEGHLRASDAATHSKYWRTTEQFVITLLKRWSDPQLAYQKIQAHKELFEKSERFMGFVKGLEGGSEEDLDVLKRLSAIEFHFEDSCESILQQKKTK